MKTESKLYPSDKQMIKLCELLLKNETIHFRQEFLDAIKMAKQNYRRVLRGEAHFTAQHIQRACKKFGANANFIMCIEKEPFNNTRR